MGLGRLLMSNVTLSLCKTNIGLDAKIENVVEGPSEDGEMSSTTL